MLQQCLPCFKQDSYQYAGHVLHLPKPVGSLPRPKCIIGRAGASSPSRAPGAIFYMYTDTLPYIYFTVALRANVKPAHCKFNGRQFSSEVPCHSRYHFINRTDNHCPSALQRFQRLLNGTPYGYLRVKAGSQYDAHPAFPAVAYFPFTNFWCSAGTVMATEKWRRTFPHIQYSPLCSRGPVRFVADLPQTEVVLPLLLSSSFVPILCEKSCVDLSTATQANAGIELESILA